MSDIEVKIEELMVILRQAKEVAGVLVRTNANNMDVIQQQFDKIKELAVERNLLKEQINAMQAELDRRA